MADINYFKSEIISSTYDPVNLSNNKPPFSPSTNNSLSAVKNRVENQIMQTRNVASIGTVIALGRSLAGSVARDIADTTGNERLISATSNSLRALALGSAIIASKGTALIPIIASGVSDLALRERQRERNNQARVFENRLLGSRVSSRTLPGAYYD